MNSLTTNGIVDMEVVDKEVQQDEDLKNMIEELKQNPEGINKFS